MEQDKKKVVMETFQNRIKNSISRNENTLAQKIDLHKTKYQRIIEDFMYIDLYNSFLSLLNNEEEIKYIKECIMSCDSNSHFENLDLQKLTLEIEQLKIEIDVDKRFLKYTEDEIIELTKNS